MATGVTAYLRTVPSDGTADARLRVPTTLDGFAAPKAALSAYLWTVPRDTFAGDALPLAPTGARLRDPTRGGVDIGALVAISGTLQVTIAEVTLTATGTVADPVVNTAGLGPYPAGYNFTGPQYPGVWRPG